MTRSAKGRLVTAIAAMVSAVGCSYNNFVNYGVGRIDYLGSRIEYLAAVPTPGTVVMEGATVEFRVRVRYTLQRAPTGRFLVWFTDTHGAQLPVEAVGIPIVQGVSVVDTVTRDVAIPATPRDLVLHIGVAAGSENGAAGELQLTYLVRRSG